IANSGSSANTVPTTQPGLSLSLGAHDGVGQWATSVISDDGLAPPGAQRANRSNGCSLIGTYVIGQCGALTAGGFTIDYSAVTTNGTRVFVLALGGVQTRAGTFAKSTVPGPVQQQISGVGFRPSLVVLEGVGLQTSDTGQVSPLHLSFGAT